MSGFYADKITVPVPIIKIIKSFGITPYVEQKIKDDIYGKIYVGGTTKDIYGKDKIIIVNSTDGYYHQRYVMAYELGQYLINYVGHDAYKNTNILFSREYIEDNNLESQSVIDKFALELLMPEKLFRKTFIKCMNESMYSEIYTLAFMSTLFEIEKNLLKKEFMKS